ncbi:MAG: hypothetical protein ABII98_01810, partial [bacterium]
TSAPKSRPIDLGYERAIGGFQVNMPEMRILEGSYNLSNILKQATTIGEIITELEDMSKKGFAEAVFNNEDAFKTQEVIDYLKAVDGGKIDLKKMPIESRELASVLESITMEQSLKKGFLGRIGDFLRGKK